jgi:spore germination protein GerM
MLLLTVIAVLLKERFTGARKAPEREKVRHEADRGESVREAKDEGKLPFDATQKKTEPKETDAAVEKDVRIYLVRFDERTEKTSIVPVTRKVKAAVPVEAAIRALIAGPTEAEKRRGLLTAVPSRLKLRDAQVRQKTAVLDFSGEIEQNASGSILLSRIDQIVYTATQFDGVESVLIRVNGKAKSVIGSDGLAIGAPLRRK